jgi:TolC family type I secretion outer membrane protein
MFIYVQTLIFVFYQYIQFKVDYMHFKKHPAIFIALGLLSFLSANSDVKALTVSLSPPAGNSNSASRSSSPLEEMLIYVYQQDPRIASARQSLKAEDEHVAEAVSGFRPTLNASGDLGRQREKIDGEDWLYGNARDESLVLNQPIFNGFGTFAQFHAARARVSAERAHLIVVEEQVFLSAITAYLDAVARHYILQFTRDNETHLRAYLDATSQRFDAGDGTKTDLAQAESRLAQASANAATAEANWEAARATYERATGLPVTSLEFPPFPDGIPVRIEETIALAQRAPEFFEAADQERAAQHDIDAASSSLWPVVSVRGTMSDQLAPELGLENLRDDSITLNATIPLYQGGADYARVREARELREKAHDDMIDTSHQMTERASQAWYNYHASLLVIDAFRKTAEASARALGGIEIEQKQGVRTLQDTLDARAEFLNSLISETQAEENARLQAYRLLASVGRLTASSLHLGTSLYDPKRHYNNVADAWAGLK